MENFLYKKNTCTNCYNLTMAYPACEAFALSSLGYLWLNKIADETSGINSQRIYTDSISGLSQNTNAIAFSMSFDFDFMGVFEILDKNNISFYSAERNENDPLIFAGGPVLTTNPEPYKNFFDFMIIGDGERVFKEVLSVLKENFSKKDCLTKLSQLKGVYVPNITAKVEKATEDLSEVIYTPIISDKSYFADTFIIEVSRGCMNRCAFCTASYTNLPFRHYPYDKIVESIELGLNYTNKIALLGAQISAHPDFNKILEFIRNKIKSGKNLEFGISSLRTDAVTPELIETLILGGQKTSTIAIEAASERLRKLINKNINETQILEAIKISRENGLKGLKIYSMIGIPTETFADIEEFIRLAKTIKKENKGFNITFSFSTFVPKPQTPFQWEKREDSKSLEKKQKFLEKELAKLSIESKFSSIKWDFWQTVLSRGDETLTPLLTEVYKNGGKLGAYKAAAKKFNINIDNYISEIAINQPLAWDFLEFYPPKQLLINEKERLYKRSLT